MLNTPFGPVEVLIDGYPAEIDMISVSKDEHWPDVNGAFRLRYVYHADGGTHKLSCLFYGSFEENDIESGERLEMRSLYCGKGKLSIGVEGEDFGEYDFTVDYLSNGLEVLIEPFTQEQEFVFGVAWLECCTASNDVQTWFMADPTVTGTSKFWEKGHMPE